MSRTSSTTALLSVFCVSTFATAHAQQFQPRFSGRLFADVNYVASERTIAQGFRLGQLVAHGSAAITDKFVFFGEATVSAGAAGYTAEIERSVIRYAFRDEFKLSAGRFHTPMGHWNTAYHHGTWLTPTASRPEMLRGDRPLFPIHLVGLMMDGTVVTPLLGVAYVAGVGNGRATLPQRAGDAGDANPNRASIVSLTLSPTNFSRARAGISLYRDELSVATVGPVRERLVVAHLTLDTDPLELVMEGMVLRHRQRVANAPPATESHAGYVLLAYRLPGAAAAFKPYARYDRVAPSRTDVVLRTTPMEASGWLAGVRYDLQQLAAIKAEFRRERLVTRTWSNTAALQFSFTFPGLPTSGAHASGGHASPETPEDR